MTFGVNKITVRISSARVLFNEFCRTNPALTEANREATAGAISAKLL